MLKMEDDGTLVHSDGGLETRVGLPYRIAKELRPLLPKDKAHKAAEVLMDKYYELTTMNREARILDIVRFIREAYAKDDGQ